MKIFRGDIGFTGTQHGMTEPQELIVIKFLTRFVDYTFWPAAISRPRPSMEYFYKRSRPPIAFHHGLCIGADEQAHHIASSLGYYIHGHPPVKQDKMMDISKTTFTRMDDPKPYLERDQVIAYKSHLLLATPKEMHEIRRSGTWTTIRRGISLNRHVIIIFPDGTTRRH